MSRAPLNLINRLLGEISLIQNRERIIKEALDTKEKAIIEAKEYRNQLIVWLIGEVFWEADANTYPPRLVTTKITYANMLDSFGIDPGWFNLDNDWSENDGCIFLGFEGLYLVCESGNISIHVPWVEIDRARFTELARHGIPIQTVIEGMIRYQQNVITDALKEKTKLSQILEEIRNEYAENQVERKGD